MAKLLENTFCRTILAKMLPLKAIGAGTALFSCRAYDQCDKVERRRVEQSFIFSRVNPGYDKSEDSLPSTSSTDEPPAYETVTKLTTKEDKALDIINQEKEDEHILTVLRDVVRKCTNPNPAKRPTAQEVMKMLEDAAPMDLQQIRAELCSDENSSRQSKKYK